MIVLHTADQHIGESEHIGGAAYLQRQEAAYQQTMQLALNIKQQWNLPYVPPILNSGDLLHKRAPTAAELTCLLKNLLMWDGHVLQVVISGNHDQKTKGGLEDSFSNLSWLEVLEKQHLLKTTTLAHWEPKVVTLGQNVWVLAIPFGCNLQEAVDQAMTEHWQQGQFWIAMAHVAVAGCKLDSGMSMESGENLPEDPRIGYWALGDIHKMQKVGGANTNAWYSGSPIQHNFGDELPKGVLVLDTDNPTQPQLCPLNVSTFATVEQGEEVPINAGYLRLRLGREVNLADPLLQDPRIVQTIVDQVATKQATEQVAAVVQTTEDPISMLPDWLRAAGHDDTSIERVVKLAHHVVNNHAA